MNKIYSSKIQFLNRLAVVILLVFMLANLNSATAQYQLINSDTLEQKTTYESAITVPSIDQSVSKQNVVENSIDNPVETVESVNSQESVDNSIDNPVETVKSVNTNPDSFISTWNTELTSDGSTNTNAIELPLKYYGNYDFIVDWGDGSTDTITNFADAKHVYATPGIYTINITGNLEGWRFSNGGDRLKIIEISQWGNIRLGNNEGYFYDGGYFYGAENLVLTATDAPDLSSTTSLDNAFRGCYKLGDQGDMSAWDVSSVTRMDHMFSRASSFNQTLNNWDVSSVYAMRSMFYNAYSFNQPLNGWNTSSVQTMGYMFYNASSFNQPLNNWDMSSGRRMDHMFSRASSFNQTLNNWDVSSVDDMSYMFSGASSFNQPLNAWDVSSVEFMSFMFYNASSFNQPIGDWDTSYVRYMNSMFAYASSFNQPIGGWDIHRGQDLSYMFTNATSFNQPLNNWNVLSKNKFEYMFANATSFNQPLNKWAVWSAVYMQGMFQNAISFDQSLRNWDVSRVTNMTDMLTGVTLSVSNYDNLLIGWSERTLQADVVFDAGNSTYSSDGADARQLIIDSFNWEISDAGLFVPIEDTKPTVVQSTTLTTDNQTSPEITTPSDLPFSNIVIVLSFIVVIPVVRRKQK